MSLHFGSKYVCAVVNQLGKLPGCSIAWLYVFCILYVGVDVGL